MCKRRGRIGFAVLVLLIAGPPATGGDAERATLENVRRALREAGLEKSVASLNVFSGGGGKIQLSGRASSADVRKKAIAIATGIAGVKKVDAENLAWPAFDMVITTSLAGGAKGEASFLAALRQDYLKSCGSAGPTEYTAADGPTGDGIVPFRVRIDHKATVTYSEIAVVTKTGEVARIDKGVIIGDKLFGERLGPGYQHIYTLSAREQGKIRYAFQKWQEDKYKDLFVVTFPSNSTAKTEVAQSDIVVGKPPTKAPACPIDIKQAREIATAMLKPYSPNFEVLGSKCTGKFADSFDVLVKRIRFAKPTDYLPVEIQFQNNTPWPIRQLSFGLADSVRMKLPGYRGCDGNADLNPPLLPGEKRKITAALGNANNGGQWSAASYSAYFTSRNLLVTRIVPQFSFSGLGN